MAIIIYYSVIINEQDINAREDGSKKIRPEKYEDGTEDFKEKCKGNLYLNYKTEIFEKLWVFHGN